MALDKAKILEKIRTKNLQITFDYDDMNKVMRIIKEHNLNIIEQELQETGKILVSVRLDDFDKIKDIYTRIHTLKVQEI